VSDIDAVALGRWLAEHVDGIGAADVTNLEIISGGASNLTIGVDMDGQRLVVRRPPVGAFLPSANDVSREYRYLSALRDTDVPVPTVYAFCDDAEVIGAPFYVMTRLEGIVPHEPQALGDITAEQGRALSERFVSVLKAIHGVDIDAVGLGDAAKRTGFLERQVSRWTDQWHRAKESDSPVIDSLALELQRRLPESPPTTIVHGDYRLGNVMVEASTKTEIIGVFDWEMATLGDPYADVGYTLLWWGTTDRPPIHPSQAVADLPGFLSADEVCRAYGADPSAFDFYIALAAFKLAIIGEGNRARARRLGQEVPGGENPLPAWALELITKGDS
jgi:aminoglycoside phosphotransferase (APT) family kinase protein